MRIVIIFFLLFVAAGLRAQTSSFDTSIAQVTIDKDPRIDILGKKMADYNDVLAGKTRMGKGYRLMVISTNDRALAMQVPAGLYKLFPDQKQYMSYQLPNIKIKFGNFEEKDEAEKFRKLIIAQKLVENNIYVLPDMVEIKPPKKDALQLNE